MSAFPTGGGLVDAVSTVDDGFVRVARRLDLDALAALERDAFSTDRLSRRSLARLLAVRSAVVLVVETACGLAGAAVLLLRSYSSRARLYSLAVSPAARGAGIGSKLLAAAERAAAERGGEWLTLEVREDNGPARALYARRGYEPTGRTADYYSDGAAAIHFRKRLEAGAEARGAAA